MRLHISHTMFCVIVFSNELLLSLQNFSHSGVFPVVRALAVSWLSYLSSRILPAHVESHGPQ